MNTNKTTEKQIKKIFSDKLNVTTSADLDNRILANSINTLENLNHPSTNKFITITKFAAVFIFISAIVIFIVSQSPEQETAKPQAASMTQTPSEMVSTLRLNIAFREGGMDSVDEQFEKAEKRVRPGLNKRLTVEELLCELNGC